METTNQTAVPAAKKRNFVFPIVLAALVIFGGWFGVSKYIHSLHHEETDDAQIEANISPVIPRVSGFVTKVFVSDNQQVKRGDTVMTLDDRDLKIKVEMAEAALATAQSNLGVARATSNAANANITTSQAGITTADAQIEAAKINVWKANQDFTRYSNLIKDHSITQQQYEQALVAKQTAESALIVLQQQKNQVTQQVKGVSSQSSATSSQIGVANAVIKQRQADVDEAKLNLSYAVVIAQADGLMSKVAVQPGQYITAGQSLFSIVLNQDVWVVANFKETQFNKIKVGQKVIVHADAFPDHDFEATLASYSPATGAKFSLLPPDNASGNFVKVVQRVPVKIQFTQTGDSSLKRLRPGMNVDVDVHLD